MNNLHSSNLKKNIVKFSTLAPEIQLLLQKAKECRERAYAPYSKFKVGAAILTNENEVYDGCNVENGAYSPSICAEKTAIVKAVSSGVKGFKAVAVVAFQENSFTSPCGSCRQFIQEFHNNDIDIYIAKPELNEVLVTNIDELLPYGFRNADD